ncbi:glycolate oxidase [Scopulibacillus darangshiensis]|uniref:Glycolate oxidase n=1 Tax=Scopulibacillus darangshiensis TaxID=442528 RepID=A0A4R2P2H5_9BACL|nr:FAD-linked oxidase C-terminal domain-containing protein [Scopulibacillus darangshiensis]TCP28832.1 glycolate oxidase [Scopulibacillus darangshiensis]
MSKDWLNALQSQFGNDRVMTETKDTHSYSFDASFGSFVPEAVIQVYTKEEIVKILKVANEYAVPVYPRGQGTSLSGGPLPVKGGIVIDMAQWDNDLKVYPEDLIVVASPGVKTSAINEAAGKYGLMYPPDPSSSHVSTIGGNLAENSGGPRGLKYGVTKDYVIGLEVVTPEGEIIRTGGKTIKNVTGYDLTKLIVGSEGTLGIITEAVLKIIPKPQFSKTMMAVFDSVVTSGEAISKVLTSGLLPAKIELMDQASIEAVENFKPIGLPVNAEAILLIEVDGHEETVNEEVNQIHGILNELGATDVVIPETKEEEQHLWMARKLVSPAITRVKPTKVSEDATVPRSQIPQMIEKLNAIKEKYHVNLVVFGHAGDGNLHPNIICDKRDKEEMIRVEKAVAEIFEAAVSLGGTLSGEHGIGTMKAPFMEMELGKAGLDMMKRIKKAWDPNDILNPGKIFTSDQNNELVLSHG